MDELWFKSNYNERENLRSGLVEEGMGKSEILFFDYGNLADNV